MLRSVPRNREQKRRERRDHDGTSRRAPGVASRAAAPPRPLRGTFWWMAIVLAAVTVGAFAEVRHFDFVNFDDQLYVTDNPHVRAGLTWAGVLWAFSSS